jgi:hypothetical protein
MTATLQSPGADTRAGIWGKLAAPLDPADIKTREQQGMTLRYTTATVVHDRLDAIVPGEWDLTLEALTPTKNGEDRDGNARYLYHVKARLQILGVIREDIGSGRDWKAASSDAFKRVAVRFGIGKELYEKDGEQPTPVPARQASPAPARAAPPAARQAAAPAAATPSSDDGERACPKCEGRMWDNRETKRNPKAPDFKCRDRSCDGVIWPPKPAPADT